MGEGQQWNRARRIYPKSRAYGLPVSSHRSATLAWSLMTPRGSALSSPLDKPQFAVFQASSSGMAHSMPSVLFPLASSLIGSTKHSLALMRFSPSNGSSFHSSCQNLRIAVVVSLLSLQPCKSLGMVSTSLLIHPPGPEIVCAWSSHPLIRVCLIASSWRPTRAVPASILFEGKCCHLSVLISPLLNSACSRASPSESLRT